MSEIELLAFLSNILSLREGNNLTAEQCSLLFISNKSNSLDSRKQYCMP